MQESGGHRVNQRELERKQTREGTNETHGTKEVVQHGTSQLGEGMGRVQCVPASSLLLWDNDGVDNSSNSSVFIELLLYAGE